MAEGKLKKCDQCGRYENVIEVFPASVAIGPEVWKSDLCADDVAPLRAVAETLPAAVPPKKRRTFDRARVKSVADIPRAQTPPKSLAPSTRTRAAAKKTPSTTKKRS
jgi:hypothetical protein